MRAARVAGGTLLALRLIVAALAIPGCGCGGQRREQGGNQAVPPFTEQVRAVLDGRAARIEAVDALGADDWESLRRLAGLRVLLLQRGVAGDAEAEILATLPDVERLVLRQSPLSDAGLAKLAGCR